MKRWTVVSSCIRFFPAGTDLFPFRPLLCPPDLSGGRLMITDVHQARLHASDITPHPTRILILVFTHKYFIFCFGESTTDYFSPFRLFHFACTWVTGGVVCLTPACKFLHLNYLTCFLTDPCCSHFLFSTFTISAFVCRNFSTPFSKLFPARKLAVVTR